MAAVMKIYDHVFTELSDKRVDNWPLMSSPLIPLSLVAFYLYMIYIYLPNFMENRKPFHLKRILIFYNCFQVVACATLIYGFTTSGLSWKCQRIDYSEDKLAMRMLQFIWWTTMLKLVEFVETAFFILRKKYNQVSKLHVYHHASTFMLCWIGTKFMGGSIVSFPITLNSFIHILMYTYYTLALFGPKMQKKIAKWKPRLTMLQMVQFCILLLHSAQAAIPSCEGPRAILVIYLPNVVAIFAMFYNFYQESYNKRRKTQKEMQS